MTVLIIVFALAIVIPAILNSNWWNSLEMKLRHDHYWINEKEWRKKNDKKRSSK